MHNYMKAAHEHRKGVQPVLPKGSSASTVSVSHVWVYPSFVFSRSSKEAHARRETKRPVGKSPLFLVHDEKNERERRKKRSLYQQAGTLALIVYGTSVGATARKAAEQGEKKERHLAGRALKICRSASAAVSHWQRNDQPQRKMDRKKETSGDD